MEGGRDRERVFGDTLRPLQASAPSRAAVGTPSPCRTHTEDGKAQKDSPSPATGSAVHVAAYGAQPLRAEVRPGKRRDQRSAASPLGQDDCVSDESQLIQLQDPIFIQQPVPGTERAEGAAFPRSRPWA